MEQILFRAMGSEIFAAIDTPDKRARERLARVPAMFEAWEQQLSRFRPDSELSQLNRHAGRPVGASHTLWQILVLAKHAETISDGLVTPAVLAALEAAGYNRSFEKLQLGIGRASDSSLQDAPVVNPAAPGWTLDGRKRTVTLEPNTRLDLGGIAKGWAAEQTAAYLGELGPALVDAGGDIVVTAPRSNGDRWVIGIENPFDARDDGMLPILLLERGAVATSGRDYRQWKRDGKPQHHLIDPRTRLPAVTDVLTATVIAPTALDAEVAAKVCLILGSAAGLEWVQARPELAGLFLIEDRRVLTSQRMEHYVA